MMMMVYFVCVCVFFLVETWVKGKTLDLTNEYFWGIFKRL